MFHSDNGGNYCCKTFQTYLIKLNVEQSFSRPYVPYNNSVKNTLLILDSYGSKLNRVFRWVNCSISDELQTTFFRFFEIFFQKNVEKLKKYVILNSRRVKTLPKTVKMISKLSRFTNFFVHRRCYASYVFVRHNDRYVYIV